MKQYNRIIFIVVFAALFSVRAQACKWSLIRSLFALGASAPTSELMAKRLAELELNPVADGDAGLARVKKGIFPISRYSYPSEYEAMLKALFGYKPKSFFDGEMRNLKDGARFGEGVKLFSLGAYEIEGIDVYQLALEIDPNGRAVFSIVTDRQFNLKKVVRVLGEDQGLLKSFLKSAHREYLDSVQVPGGAAYTLPSNQYRLRYEVTVERDELTAFMMELESLLSHSDRHF